MFGEVYFFLGLVFWLTAAIFAHRTTEVSIMALAMYWTVCAVIQLKARKNPGPRRLLLEGISSLVFCVLLLQIHLIFAAALFAIGTACNIAVMAANDWRMPIVYANLHGLELSLERSSEHFVAETGGYFLFLGDRFRCGYGIFSIGDILLLAALFFADATLIWRLVISS